MKRIAWVLAVFICIPLVLFSLGIINSMDKVIWLFVIYFCVVLSWVLFGVSNAVDKVLLFFVVFMVAPVAFFIVGLLGTEANKKYWDHHVRDLCEKNGGVQVYKKVKLTRDEYDRYGGVHGAIPVPGENSSLASKSPYLSSRTRTYIRKSNPRVSKWESVIFEKASRENLGKLTIYSRGGGDLALFFWAHPSSFSCRDIEGFQSDLERQVFIIEGRENQ